MPVKLPIEVEWFQKLTHCSAIYSWQSYYDISVQGSILYWYCDIDTAHIFTHSISCATESDCNHWSGECKQIAAIVLAYMWI